ncbi:hypothetical protein CISG_08169 [Coccidioides immitis RMSCC 3703]|uniref:Uncharacterized protein n=1 Tax=Coccidioides immitis RMSCC 3703 TaxID=454286 RepID=A0A0J8R4F5_COCIT|nr:hypothetical protein CISG_08169 [Coccidioides immitis RMSCC 3703]
MNPLLSRFDCERAFATASVLPAEDLFPVELATDDCGLGAPLVRRVPFRYQYDVDDVRSTSGVYRHAGKPPEGGRKQTPGQSLPRSAWHLKDRNRKLCTPYGKYWPQFYKRDPANVTEARRNLLDFQPRSKRE